MVCKHIAMALLAAFAGASTFAPAAHAATGTSTTSATVYHRMTLASLLDLSFGTVISDGTQADVVLNNATHSRDCAAGTTCQGSFAFATLHITGSPAVVQVTYNPVIQLLGPGDPMNVDVQFPGGSGALVNSDGNTTIELGAILHINADQLAGDYSANFSVDVNYP
jgi:Domain of unknown function (DUF4402)